MSIKLIVVSVVCYLLSNDIGAQNLYNRIEANISIKEVFSDGKKSLMMGKVFYDFEVGKLVYDISFPENEVMILSKDHITSIKKDTSITAPLISSELVDFSIYKLLLEGELKTFGLEENKFVIGNIEDLGNGKVISEWLPNARDVHFKIVISQMNNLIDGIAFFDEHGILKRKQLFKDYNRYGRIKFPHSIYEFSYTEEGGQYKKLTTHSNIKINDYSDDQGLYNASVDSVDAFFE